MQLKTKTILCQFFMIMIAGLLVPVISIAQQNNNRLFALRPNGFRAFPDTSKNYIVVDVPNTSNMILYDRALKEVNKLYSNPQFVKSVIEGKSIVIHARQPNVFKRVSLRNLFVDYSFQIDFKPGKARIEPLSFAFVADNGEELSLVDHGGIFSRGIFNENGSYQRQEAKTRIDYFFNSIVFQIIYAMKNDDKSDW